MYMSNKEQANIMNEQMDPKDPTRTHENMELKTIGIATVALVCIFNSAYFRSPNSLHGLFSYPCFSGSYPIIQEVSMVCHQVCKSFLTVCLNVPIFWTRNEVGCSWRCLSSQNLVSAISRIYTTD